MDNVGRVGNAECAAAVIALLVMRVLRPRKMIDSIGIYGGSVCGNSDMESGKQAEKGCSVGKRKRNGKRPDRGKKNIMPLRRIWIGGGA